LEAPVDRHSVEWRGYWAAAPTPFTAAGDVDEGSLRRVLRDYVESGVHGVVVNGTTGEWFSQDLGERQSVAAAAVHELSGRIPVVIGCSSTSVRETLQLAKHAASVGADGIMCTPPPYIVPTSAEIVAYYKRVSDVGIPIMVYNWPKGTSVELSGQLVEEVCDVDNVVALKDSTLNLEVLLTNLQRCSSRVRVFMSLISPLGASVINGLGGDGAIDGGALGGRHGVRFFEALWRGDLEAAIGHGRDYRSLMDRLIGPGWTATFGSPQAQLKAAMNLLGEAGGFPRPPLLPLNDRELKQLRGVLAEAGLETVEPGLQRVEALSS
jgi:1-pyrroline-4-hydroxy-2-carboxylate deaminase